MPNRILKETICTSENVAALSCEAEVLFYRLIVQADDFGRMDARLAILRARCYPLQLARVGEAELAGWLAELVAAELIETYVVRGQPYLCLRTWGQHQQTRAQRSKYPGIDESDSTCKHVLADDSGCVLKRNTETEARTETESESNTEAEAEAVTRACATPDPPATAAAAAPAAETYPEQIQAFTSRVGMIASAYMSQEMLDRLDELRERDLLAWWGLALNVAEANGVRTWAYVRGTLDNCLRSGKPPGAPKSGANGHGKSASRGGAAGALRADSAVDAAYRAANTPAALAAARAAFAPDG